MDDVLRAALDMQAMGFAVHFLRPGSKIPIHSGWADAPVPTRAELISTYRPGYNVGFRAGHWSVVDAHEIVVLDVDIKGGASDAEQAYARAAELIGGPAEFTVQSGSGWGRHLYMRVPLGTAPSKAATDLATSATWVSPDGRRHLGSAPGLKPAWNIELLSTGKNVVAPPSIHPDTGKPYKWL